MAEIQATNDAATTQGTDLAAVYAVQAMQHEIDLHRKHDKQKSYLGQAINFIWRDDESKLSSLEQFKQATEKSIQNGSVGDIDKLKKQTYALINKDQKAIGLQDEINHYGGTLLKVGALFYGGSVGWGATGALYAADQANPNDSWGTQLIDGTLGATKGLLTKGVISEIGGQNWNFGVKGAAMGITNRIVDEGLTRQTYLDSSTGEFSFGGGLMKTAKDSFNLHAIGTDVVVFGAAAGLGSAVTKLAPVIAESPLYSMMATSATFGLASGSINEYERERAAGEKIDWGKIAMRGGLEGAVFALAAVPGGMQAESRMNKMKEEIEARAKLLSDLRANGDSNAARRVSFDGQNFELKVGEEKTVDRWLTSGDTAETMGRKIIGRDAQGDYVRVEGMDEPGRSEALTVNGKVVRRADGKVYIHPADEIVNNSITYEKPQKMILTFNASETSSMPQMQYQKPGAVKAEQLTKDMTWQTGNGSTMTGQAGDWVVTGPDGSQWTVQGSIFGKTYKAVDGKPGEFQKVPTTAQQLDRPVTVQTREGVGTGKAGDYLVTGPEGDQYVVTKAKFESMYVPIIPVMSVEQTSSLYDQLKAQGREYSFEKRLYEATVRPAQAGEKLTTIVGDESTAVEGQYRVTRTMLNGKVDEYFIFPDKLISRWQPAGGQQPGEPGVYTPKPGAVTKMVELDRPASLKPSWSSTPFTGRAGDFLATYGAGDFNIVHFDALADTYQGIDPQSLAKSQNAVARVQAGEASQK